MFDIVRVANAQTFSKVMGNPVVKDLTTKITEEILSPIIGVMFLLAFVTFVYGIYGMISSSDDSEKRENGKRSIFYGSAGMAIMFSVYGIIRLIAATVGADDPFL